MFHKLQGADLTTNALAGIYSASSLTHFVRLSE
jgi:hypothetical protein